MPVRKGLTAALSAISSSVAIILRIEPAIVGSAILAAIPITAAPTIIAIEVWTHKEEPAMETMPEVVSRKTVIGETMAHM